MSVLSDKYRGTENYQQVRDLLVQAASKNKNVFYGKIAEVMGLELNEAASKEIGHLLGEINEDEHNQGRAMLSAVAINAIEKTPGDGFYKLASLLDRFNGTTEEERMDFWRTELQKVYAAW